MTERAPLITTLDGRFWLATGVGTILALGALGMPTAVLPNPFFVRTTPTQPLDVAFWLASAPLIGLIFATYVAKRRSIVIDPHTGAGGTSTSLAGIGSFLAIGCPICNKIIVGLLGVSGAMTVFAPLQPLIGAGSVALLGVTLVYRLRLRTRGCMRCARSPADVTRPLAGTT